jgi:hypothetical protein
VPGKQVLAGGGDFGFSPHGLLDRAVVCRVWRVVSPRGSSTRCQDRSVCKWGCINDLISEAIPHHFYNIPVIEKAADISPELKRRGHRNYISMK